MCNTERKENKNRIAKDKTAQLVLYNYAEEWEEQAGGEGRSQERYLCKFTCLQVAEEGRQKKIHKPLWHSASPKKWWPYDDTASTNLCFFITIIFLVLLCLLFFLSSAQMSNHSRTTALSNSMKLRCPWGNSRRAGYGGEIWQNGVHWRREWQTTSVLLPWEPHEQYEIAKW